MEKLKTYCADVKLIGIKPLPRRIWSTQALLSGQSLTQAYYRSPELQTWIDDVVPRCGIRHGLAYCSATSQ